MNHHGVACRLPVELLSLIFDQLALQELMSASRVSTFWRTVGFRHRTFWSDITLEALSTTALDFFHARLDAGGTRTVTLRVYLFKPEFPARLRSVVLPAIARNLHRVDKLHLEADKAYERDVFSALQHPAPRLVTFDVYIGGDTQPSDALPIDLFAGHAPGLRNVQLLNVQLTADALPAVLSAVTLLKYCFAEAQSLPDAVFAHCRALDTLIIYGRHFTLASSDEGSSTVEVPKLEFIDLSLDTGSLELLRCLPSASIFHICVPLTDYDLALFLLGHLHQGLEVKMNHTVKDFELLYRSLDTGLQRSFVCGRGQIDLVFLPPIYVYGDLLARVQMLRSTSTCAALFPAFTELAFCTRVILTIADFEPLKPPKYPLSTPRLERIEISSSSTARLSVDDLTAFLNAAFIPIDHAVEVTLDGVSLDGDPAVIPGDQFAVSTRPEIAGQDVIHSTTGV